MKNKNSEKRTYDYQEIDRTIFKGKNGKNIIFILKECGKSYFKIEVIFENEFFYPQPMRICGRKKAMERWEDLKNKINLKS